MVGTAKGSPKEATTFLPSPRRARAKASIDPRASPSGWTWQARQTSSALSITATARSQSASEIMLPADQRAPGHSRGRVSGYRLVAVFGVVVGVVFKGVRF